MIFFLFCFSCLLIFLEHFNVHSKILGKVQISHVLPRHCFGLIFYPFWVLGQLSLKLQALSFEIGGFSQVNALRACTFTRLDLPLASSGLQFRNIESVNCHKLFLKLNKT